MDSSRNKVTRTNDHNHNEFSIKSIMNVIKNFVNTVQEMEQTILVPTRLMDVHVSGHSGVPLIQPVQNLSESIGKADLYTLYKFIRYMKYMILWSSSELQSEEGFEDINIHPCTECSSSTESTNDFELEFDISHFEKEFENETTSIGASEIEPKDFESKEELLNKTTTSRSTPERELNNIHPKGDLENEPTTVSNDSSKLKPKRCECESSFELLNEFTGVSTEVSKNELKNSNCILKEELINEHRTVSTQTYELGVKNFGIGVGLKNESTAESTKVTECDLIEIDHRVELGNERIKTSNHSSKLELKNTDSGIELKNDPTIASTKDLNFELKDSDPELQKESAKLSETACDCKLKSTDSCIELEGLLTTASDTASEFKIQNFDMKLKDSVDTEPDTKKLIFIQEMDETFKKHLYGLKHCLEQTTDIAFFLMKCYQFEIGFTF